jgi:hypothetical protein
VQAYQSVSGFSAYAKEFLIILLRPIKASGISNIRVGVVYKAKHEVCTQVVAFSVPGAGCSYAMTTGLKREALDEYFGTKHVARQV